MTNLLPTEAVSFQVIKKVFQSILTFCLDILKILWTISASVLSGCSSILLPLLNIPRADVSVRMSPSKKATVESREVGLTGTKCQKSARENYTHSSMRSVTFALCHSSGECNFVSNTRLRTRCVWFNGSRVPRKVKDACKYIFPAFK